MVETERVFQISRIKNLQMKRELLQGIQRLGGKYIGGSMYSEEMTHLIVCHVMASEKFLAACAGGKWILMPKYVLDSAKNGAWLPEEVYEVDINGKKTPWPTNPIQVWRERVVSRSVSGAFQDWRVVLRIDDPSRRDMFKRILKAGKATIYSSTLGSDQKVTHVFAEHVTKDKDPNNVLQYSVDHIAQHLFGSHWSERSPDVSDGIDLLFSGMETQLRDHVSKLEPLKGRLVCEDFLTSGPSDHQVQSPVVDFSNVHSLIECCLFTEALEEIQGALQPGVLPPPQILSSLMQHALHDELKPYFYSTFRTVLYNILRNNPSWGSPTVVKYFLNVLQCPQCKGGTLALLEMSVRLCTSSKSSCHSIPSPSSPEQIRFYCDLLAFVLKLYQFELFASSQGKPGGSRSSVLVSTFWSIWEKATPNTRAIHQLIELLLHATCWALPPTEDWKQGLVFTLNETLSVVVDYWCQENYNLNRNLVDKGMEELAEHIAILCQDLPPAFFLEFIPRIPSMMLRMFISDSIFRNICCRNGITIGTESLSLLKIVSSYLQALGRLCKRGPVRANSLQAQRSVLWPAGEPATASCASRQPANLPLGSQETLRTASFAAHRQSQENIPRGLHKVNTAGEVLLHRACRKNQVETLLRILSLPGTDVNVKDHAGWTPLHEACNHGSSSCVRALLQHCPTLHLDSQVDGISPLHDALLNGHVDIANMLLCHAGSSLLQLRDSEGRTALDLASSPALKEQLRASAQERDSVLGVGGSDVWDLHFLEACSCLLSCLLLSYLLVRGVPSYEALAGPQDTAPRLARALASHSALRVTAGWGNPRLVLLAEDLETLLGMGRYLHNVALALRGCPGPHTSLLLLQLEELEADGKALLGDTAM